MLLLVLTFPLKFKYFINVLSISYKHFTHSFSELQIYFLLGTQAQIKLCLEKPPPKTGKLTVRFLIEFAVIYCLIFFRY